MLFQTLISSLSFIVCFSVLSAQGSQPKKYVSKRSSPSTEKHQIATFAGGCFWCMQPPFDKLPGIIKTTVGYSGGHVHNPTYEQVTKQNTGHLESIQIVFDPSVISYEALLDTFWRNIDPTDSEGQFCDKGSSYKSAIFYHTPEQRQKAEDSKSKLEKNSPLKNNIVTEVVPAKDFYPSEQYHQDYYKKNPVRYKFYRYRCGRDQKLKELWGSS